MVLGPEAVAAADDIGGRSRRGPDIGGDNHLHHSYSCSCRRLQLVGEVAHRRTTSGWATRRRRLLVVERRHVGDLLPVGVVPAPALLLVIVGASALVVVLVRVLSRSVADYVSDTCSYTVVIEVCL